MVTIDFTSKTKLLIDNLKSVCAQYGLGNDGNEFKIIVQVFLFKFLNDKFAHEIKKLDERLRKSEKWEEELANYTEKEYEMLIFSLPVETAKLKQIHLISYLYNNQNRDDYAMLFDDTLNDIAVYNSDIFSVKTGGGAQVTLFDKRLSHYITDESERDSFCKALINPLVNFSFEGIFSQKYDFFATIFEYLIKDYNTDSGGKYAEYYTPHAVAKIMAEILVEGQPSNVTCCDPSAGSGTLLMSLAHRIGEDRCTIYSQDISQKSSTMLRLNLILNNLVHSIPNIIQGDTLLNPYHKENNKLQKFHYIVSNPPFKLDFSNIREDLDSEKHHDRFFAGVPKVPSKKVESMAIYLLFIQHIIYSLKPNGKAAVVVPTGFLTYQSGIEKKIRQKLVDKKMLGGVVSMPSNIFASTGTNVSILFIDKTNQSGNIVLLDASKLGDIIKDGKNQKTLLSTTEEQQIIDTFINKAVIEDFSVVVSYDEIKEKNYSFSAGQYFDVKIEYSDISPEEFTSKIQEFKSNLKNLFTESKRLETKIQMQLEELKYE
ncbi:MAG: class I SAM-dependent DNA methyltransferase [Prolixibacteraceae bacterium]|jgi:type I restriction enzyme M protein